MPQSNTIRFDYTLLERLVDMEKPTNKLVVPLGKKERAEIQKMADHFGVSKSKYLRLLHICVINAYMTGQFEGFVDNHKELAGLKRFKKSLYNKEWEAKNRGKKENCQEKD